MKRLLLALLALALASPAFAQSFGETAGGATVPGHANFCFTGATNADGSLAVVPCNSSNPLPVVVSSSAPGTAPVGVTMITGNSTGTTGAVTGTLAGVANKTTYICGFTVNAIGGTAAVGPITVSNTLTANMVYQLTDVTTGVLFSQTYSPCIPATAANTAITIATTASAGATAVDVNSWGFQVATNPYPYTQITGNSTGSTGAVVGTLAGTSGKITYICGFSVSAAGGTATIGPVTVANLITGNMVYQGNSTATGVTPIVQQFNPCVPANAANTNITVTTTADGTATAVDVNSWGFQQ